jgi:hypothetical protein
MKKTKFYRTGLEFTFDMNSETYQIMKKEAKENNERARIHCLRTSVQRQYYATRFLVNKVVEAMEDYQRNNTLEQIYNDEGLVEVCTNPTTSRRELVKMLKLSTKVLAEHGFVPSVERDLLQDGGCHINIDPPKSLFKDYPGYWGNDKEINHQFIDFARDFIKANPGIKWAFLIPNDIYSCSGDHFLEPKDDKFIELRFFRMVNNEFELNMWLDFAQLLMHYLYKNWNKLGRPITKPLHTFTEKEVLLSLKKVCKEIGFDYRLLVKNGNIESIKTRISWGKRFMV